MDFDMFSSCPAPGLGDSSLSVFTSKSSLNVASALLLTILGKENVDGLFFSNLSVGSSPAWYFHLTPFETLFCGMLILQIFVLRYLEILPINVNNWFVGDPAGRRKRSIHKKSPGTTYDLAEATFSLLRRLDDQDCLLKSLCILQAESGRKTTILNIPKETKGMISALALSGRRRRKQKDSISTEENDLETPKNKKRSSMESFEDAVLVGSEIGQQMTSLRPEITDNRNSTLDLCRPNYRACSVSSDDIIRYINIIVDAGMI